MTTAARALVAQTLLVLGVMLATVGAHASAQQRPVPARRASAPKKATSAPPPKATAKAPAPAAPPPSAAPDSGVSTGASTAVQDSTWRWTVVTYLSGASIYLDAGSLQGLREGARVEVVRGDAVVATLEVQFLASARAAARLVQGVDVVLNDRARFRPAVTPVVTATTSTNATPTATTQTGAAAAVGDSGRAVGATSRRTRARTVSARVGVRYLSLSTGASTSGRVTQPALDARVEGHRIGGTSLGLLIDARAHRQRSGAGVTTSSTRVYQTSLEYQGAGAFPVRVTAGRQLSTVLSPLGFFDGVTLEVDRIHWRVGGLGGTQPDFTTFQPSGAIRELGGWLQWHTAPGSATLFQSTVGAVGSYDLRGINREFALLSSVLVTPRFSWYITQEVDVNRGWRRSAESGHSVTPTSTFATARASLTRAVALHAGYDSRRSVRLYRDFLTPDLAFDDAFRRGYWGGASLSVPHVYASADLRSSDGATVGRNTSATASLSLSRLGVLGLGTRLRATKYDGPTVAGLLTSISAEVEPWGRVRIETTIGRREDRRAQIGAALARTTWVGFDADAGLGRSWYLMASSYREVGDSERLLQQYLGLSWRY
ncbi:MAG: hypothetical protein IT353_09210 [Gemmatimonadaceae bacterium]|nr:hypothetical protein [Gemmatimonadaceae bacterium]